MAEGIEVTRLNDGSFGPSNLLSDLVWYMLTDKDTGSGELINSGLIDQDALKIAGRYLEANQLFFDDAIADSINIRTWLGNIAPTVLCNLSQKNGRFSMEPALPYDAGYRIDASRAIEIKAMFTDGNIIEDSLNIEWLDLEQRAMFQAAVIYRWTGLNKLPEQRTIVVRGASRRNALIITPSISVYKFVFVRTCSNRESNSVNTVAIWIGKSSRSRIPVRWESSGGLKATRSMYSKSWINRLVLHIHLKGNVELCVRR